MNNKKNLILSLIGWGVFGVLVVFFIREGSEVVDVLRQIQWQWLILAVIIKMGKYWSAAFVLGSLLRHFGHKLRFPALFRNSFMISYLNQTLPSWGMGGLAFMILDLKKSDNISPAKSITSGVMFYALSFFSFFVILCVSFIALALNKQLKFIYLSAAFFAFVFVLTVSTILLISFFKRERLKKITSFLLKPVQKLSSQNIGANNNGITEEEIKPENVTGELEYTFRSLPKSGPYMLSALIWSFSFHLFDVLTLYAFFMGFGYPISISVLLGGFTLATVFGFVSFVPGAIGIFETSMALVYTSLGVPFQVATLVALAFRGLGFWLPIPIGGWLSKQFFHKTLKSGELREKS